MKRNKVTIHDIAKALNIDSSTVSRALNGSSRVTQRTKTKILDKAKEMGYHRNLLAANLRRRRSNSIGVIVPRISRFFFSSVIAGIEETAYEAGYNVIICQSLEQLEREKNIVNSLMANRVDGVLISVSMETKDHSHFINLKKNGIPFMFFDRHCSIEGIGSVLIDDFQGGYDATEHLISKRCKTIAHFAGPQELKIYQNRLMGYRAALEKHHFEYREQLVLTSRLMEKDGNENARKLLTLPIKVDGIFAANDMSAIGAMKYLKAKGVNIPKDIAIVGFSNEPVSAVMEPTLTTIDQPGFKMGNKATELLLKNIELRPNFKNNGRTILESNLIERYSTKK